MVMMTILEHNTTSPIDTKEPSQRMRSAVKTFAVHW
jgi:hypothetical protein